MNKLWMLLFLFTVTVRMPMKGTIVYKDVEKFRAGEGMYQLYLQNGKMVIVPQIWTIIEED